MKDEVKEVVKASSCCASRLSFKMQRGLIFANLALTGGLLLSHIIVAIKQRKRAKFLYKNVCATLGGHSVAIGDQGMAISELQQVCANNKKIKRV